MCMVFLPSDKTRLIKSYIRWELTARAKSTPESLKLVRSSFTPGRSDTDSAVRQHHDLCHHAVDSGGGEQYRFIASRFWIGQEIGRLQRPFQFGDFGDSAVQVVLVECFDVQDADADLSESR